MHNDYKNIFLSTIQLELFHNYNCLCDHTSEEALGNAEKICVDLNFECIYCVWSEFSFLILFILTQKVSGCRSVTLLEQNTPSQWNTFVQSLLRSRCSLVLQRSAVLKTQKKTCMIKCNFTKAYHFATEECCCSSNFLLASQCNYIYFL